MTALLYLSTPERGAVFRAHLARTMPDLEFHEKEAPDPDKVVYAVAWTCPPDFFDIHPNLKVLISVGAGVDQLDLSRIPPHVRVVRMLEPGLPEQMAEYVTMATLMLHRDMPFYLNNQRDGRWQAGRNRPARERRVGVMGLGQLGSAALEALRPFGFPLAGWSRRGIAPAGVEGFTDLDAFLARTDILVSLLPLTDETKGMLNLSLFDRLPNGACLVQVGRGQQLVATDLIAALDRGHLQSAVLDVTDPEPLVPDHPLWRHPQVLVTPHIACQTRAEDGAAHVTSVIAAHKAGTAVPGMIDRRMGY